MLVLCPATSGAEVVLGAVETSADHADSPSPRRSKETIGVASFPTLIVYRQTDLLESEFLEAGPP